LFRVLVKKKADLAKALFFFRKNQTQTQTKHVRALINDKIIINIGPPYHREEEKKFGGDKRDQGESASLFFFLARALRFLQSFIYSILFFA